MKYRISKKYVKKSEIMDANILLMYQTHLHGTAYRQERASCVASDWNLMKLSYKRYSDIMDIDKKYKLTLIPYNHISLVLYHMRQLDFLWYLKNAIANIFGKDKLSFYIVDIDYFECLFAKTKISVHEGLITKNPNRDHVGFQNFACNITQSTTINTSFSMYSTIIAHVLIVDNTKLNLTFKTDDIEIALFEDTSYNAREIP